MRKARFVVAMAIGVATLSLAPGGCAGGPTNRTARTGPVATGPESLEATRRAMEGASTLVSLEVVDAEGSHRPVQATGQLTYDAYGNLTIKGVIADAALRSTLVIDYTGRIVIDPVRHQYYPADLATDRPVAADQIAPVSPDKLRRYELSANAFVVTYLDASGKPTAVARWRRPGK